MKSCSSCGVLKGLDEFQARKASKDGKTSACRTCLHARDNARNHRPERVAARQAYAKTDQGKAARTRATRAWSRRNPAWRRAQVAVSNALRDGHLVRHPCECCGAPEVEGHHPDYSQPLAVVWLCPPHHRELHETHEAAQLSLA